MDGNGNYVCYSTHSSINKNEVTAHRLLELSSVHMLPLNKCAEIHIGSPLKVLKLMLFFEVYTSKSLSCALGLLEQMFVNLRSKQHM